MSNPLSYSFFAETGRQQYPHSVDMTVTSVTVNGSPATYTDGPLLMINSPALTGGERIVVSGTSTPAIEKSLTVQVTNLTDTVALTAATTAAGTSATAAANSATAAATSATAASASSTGAGNSASSANTAATNAGSSATAAATSATAAAASAASISFAAGTSDVGLRSREGGIYLDGAPLTPETLDSITARDIAFVEGFSARRSAELRAFVPSGLAPYGPGVNHHLAVGQSFEAGAVTMAKLLSTASRLATEVGAYQAKMVGLSDRSQFSDPKVGGAPNSTYVAYGTTRVLNPLVATCVTDNSPTVASDADVAVGNFSTSARGETPCVTAALTFEVLWREFMQLDGPDTSRCDVVTNIAKTGATLQQISTDYTDPLDGSTSGTWSRTIDSAQAVLDARTASMSGAQARLSCVSESHGQADNASHTSVADYTNGHKTYRDNVHSAIAAGKYGQKTRAAWFTMQASGGYASFENWTSMAQANMGTDTATHSDYFLCGPDYPYPSFTLSPVAPVQQSHPWLNNRHPLCNGSRQRGSLQGRARYYVQILKRNWFPMRMAGAWYRNGSYSILVGMQCMAAPVRINQPVAIGVTMKQWAAQGFTVAVRGSFVTIDAVSVVDDHTIRVDCAEPFSSAYPPQVNIGDYSVTGTTNIRDSFKFRHIFPYLFIPGFTDTNLSDTGYDDPDGLENIAEWVNGWQDVGNWCCTDSVTAQLLPNGITGVA